MKKVYFTIFLFIIGLQLSSQHSIYPDLLIIGGDTLPSEDRVVDTFFVFDMATGGFAGGLRSSRAWDRDSIGAGSFASGISTMATGEGAVALGYFSTPLAMMEQQLLDM